MRNDITMYTLKPIISLPRVLHHRKTMYEMRNIHEEQSTDNHTETECKIVPNITEQAPLPGYNELEIRQERILMQLADLKKQVSTLSNFLNHTKQDVISNDSPRNGETVSINLVINANPRNPPYSILALQKIWSDTEINVKTYTHSSIKQGNSLSYNASTSPSGKNIINLSLIWKDVSDLEVVCGLYGYCIVGEANLLRYLSRLIRSHNYESSNCAEKVNRTDLILDLCHSIHFETSSKRRDEIFLSIADKLGTNCSVENDIANVAVWCTIRQVIPKKCPPKLKQWYDACEKCFV